MKPTGTAGRQERARRQALKEAAREARHTERQTAKEKSCEETREFRRAFLNIFERITNKICGDKNQYIHIDGKLRSLHTNSTFKFCTLPDLAFLYFHFVPTHM